MRQILNTLYVMTPHSYFHLENDTITAMLDSGKLPPPANDARCKECSLREICQPDALAERCRLKSLREELFNVAG